MSSVTISLNFHPPLQLPCKIEKSSQNSHKLFSIFSLPPPFQSSPQITLSLPLIERKVMTSAIFFKIDSSNTPVNSLSRQSSPFPYSIPPSCLSLHLQMMTQLLLFHSPTTCFVDPMPTPFLQANVSWHPPIHLFFLVLCSLLSLNKLVLPPCSRNHPYLSSRSSSDWFQGRTFNWDWPPNRPKEHHATKTAPLSSLLILLYVSAAFATIIHQLLLLSQATLGFCGTALKSFVS